MIDIVERFEIDCDDWFTLLAACSQINELKHGVESIDEAEKRIPELVDSQFSSSKNFTEHFYLSLPSCADRC